jgi:hypothetical protein
VLYYSRTIKIEYLIEMLSAVKYLNGLDGQILEEATKIFFNNFLPRE